MNEHTYIPFSVPVGIIPKTSEALIGFESFVHGLYTHMYVCTIQKIQAQARDRERSPKGFPRQIYIIRLHYVPRFLPLAPSLTASGTHGCIYKLAPEFC